MGKPHEYRETHTISAEVLYRSAGRAGGETQASEGVLRPGRVVWSEDRLSSADPNSNVTVYAEGIGLIDLPAGVLSQDRLTSLRR